MNDPAVLRKRTWTARVIRPGDQIDMDGIDAEFWRQIPVDERTEVAWQLSEELWALSGAPDNDEPGLSRSTARVIRR